MVKKISVLTVCFLVKPVMERKLLMVSIIFSLQPLYALSGLALIRRVNGSIPNFKFELVNESLIVKALQGLKASKASGLDNISPRMMKDAAVVVAKPLTRIVNESLSQETVPSEWQYAEITPLYKKGMSTDMDNYRPVLAEFRFYQLCPKCWRGL